MRAETATDSVWSEKEKKIRDRYCDMEMRLQDPSLPDNEAEEAMDMMLELEKEYPALLLSALRPKRSAFLEGLLHERKILSGILKEAPATREVREVPKLTIPHMQKNKQEEKA